MTSCWAAEENCCVHCKHGDIQQGFGPRTFILCACCQDRGSHVECEEKATGIWLSLITVPANDCKRGRMQSRTNPTLPFVQNSLRHVAQDFQYLHMH